MDQGFLKTYTELKNLKSDKNNKYKVCCPFPHKREEFDPGWQKVTVEYYDANPSAIIDLENNTFTCPYCGELNENTFKRRLNKELKNNNNYSKISKNIEYSVLKKKCLSKVQIVATCSEIYAINEEVEFLPKEKVSNDDVIGDIANSKDIIDKKKWVLKDNLDNFLELIEMGIGDKDKVPIYSRLLHINRKNLDSYNIKFGNLKTVYKTTVADEVVENDDYVSEVTIDMYTFEPLEIGNNYEIEYKLFPHPKAGQKVIGVATKINKTIDEVDLFDKDFVKSLNEFKVETTVKAKIDKLYISAKNHIAPYLNKDLWLMCELVFNSPLDLTYIKPIRGALDVFILGDTRTGKSETSRALRELYDFGSVVPLKTATTQSLIGGTSDKDKKTKLGILPREHKGLVVLEEFSGAPIGFTKTMTEIRSSGIVKLYRVNSGELKAPCKLRMITISNASSNDDGFPRLLSIFPNGVEPIIELVNSAEDIARYDAFILVPKVAHRTNPFDKISADMNYKLKAIHYKNKIQWVRTLKAEDIIISNEVGNYIFNKSIELNNLFESNFTLFGSESDKKLARFSASLACMLVSSEDNKNVIVKKEHVDYIFDLFIKIYDNEYFRLKEYTMEQKEYSIVVTEDTEMLQSLYPKHTTVIDLISNKSKINRNELFVASGQDRDSFGKMFNIMVARKFIKLSQDLVVPTEKFRKTYKLLNKKFNLYDKTKNSDTPF